MDKWDVFKSASAMAESAGASNRKLSRDEVDSLANAVNTIWIEINPHNSMELVALIARVAGPKNMDGFVNRAISVLEKQSDFHHEVKTNSAGHCLVAAVLINETPELLDQELIRANAQRLATYKVNNCPYTREDLEILRRQITPYL